MAPPHSSHFDTAVVGDGIIGLSAALELARAGATCALIGTSEPGAGSGAAAGILAPSVGRRDSGVRNFFRYSLELFPAFLAPLREFEPDLALLQGLLEIASPPDDPPRENGSRWLTDTELRQTEPALHAPHGAVLHPHDGAVDNGKILSALRQAVSRHPSITMMTGDGAARIDVTTSPAGLAVRDGSTLRANHIVLAAGAWSARLEGLPRALPVFPLKGQMIALDAEDVIRHPVMTGHVYLVPRGRELFVGATSEEVGFDTAATEEAERSLRAAAVEACPTLAAARVTRRWAGLRPATPDLLPIIGPDPESPALIYACGHSRNGILLAPATALAVRAAVESEALPPFVERLAIGRFSG